MMTKKHYKQIAEAIKKNSLNTQTHGGVLYKFLFMDDIMAMFKEDNPRFDEDKFFEACIE